MSFSQFARRLPKTRSGKIMRRVLRKVVERDVNELGDLSTLDDPAAVQEIIKGHHELCSKQQPWWCAYWKHFHLKRKMNVMLVALFHLIIVSKMILKANIFVFIVHDFLMKSSKQLFKTVRIIHTCTLLLITDTKSWEHCVLITKLELIFPI